MDAKQNDDPPGRYRCTERQWNDWNWQIKNRIRTIEQFKEIFGIDPSSVRLEEVIKRYPFAITPYYASLIKKFDYSDPIFAQSVPNMYELEDSKYLSDDPLHESEEMAVPFLVHRYKDRALLMSTSTCSMYCRHSLAKGSRILMSDLSEKNIEDVAVGDHVISHTGNLCRVYDVFNRKYSKDIIDIKTSKNLKITTTQEHPFLVIKREDILCNSGKKRSICKPNSAFCKKRHKRRETSFIPKFIDASHIEKGDFIATPRYKNDSVIKYKDVDMGYLIGLYLSEGDLPKRGTGEYICARFSFGYKEKETLAKSVVEISDKMGYRKATISAYKEKSHCYAKIFDKDLCEFLNQNIGIYSHCKKMSNEILYNSSDDFLFNILRGCVDGDGHVRISNREQGAIHSIEFNTSSEIMANQIFMISSKLGFKPSFYPYNPNGRTSKLNGRIIKSNRVIYRIRLNGKDDYNKWFKREKDIKNDKSMAFCTDQYVFSEVVKVVNHKKYKEDDLFYDLSVERDESYVANKMIVHNCTRKRMAGKKECHISSKRLDKIRSYLSKHSEIHDVIVSGGDPFTQENSFIEEILETLRAIPHIEIIRFGTRTPVVMPQRITPKLVALLKKYKPLWINTHFNHPSEITPESSAACRRIVDGGIPMGNQTVLLKGVNDNSEIIKELCRKLITIGVKPYYIYQSDLVRGSEHFRTSLQVGIDIMKDLRGRLSGIAIPTFVVDAPGGKGKIPVLPNYYLGKKGNLHRLVNYEGEEVIYPD
jgi:KamA family protein